MEAWSVVGLPDSGESAAPARAGAQCMHPACWSGSESLSTLWEAPVQMCPYLHSAEPSAGATVEGGSQVWGTMGLVLDKPP